MQGAGERYKVRIVGEDFKMADGRDYQSELESIYNGIAESVLEASDEEIEEEMRAEGLDPAEEAERVRAILRSAVANHQASRSGISTWWGVWVKGMPIPDAPIAVFNWREHAERWAEAEYPGLYEIRLITPPPA
jgi:hypothetical protein